MRRFIDVVVAVIVCVVGALVIAVIALLVLASLGRPVLFRQERCGLEGRAFTVVKFRTMRAPACPGEADDHRTPAIGRLLRASSLDELPQLWNILRGDLSLIGPRPTLPEQVARYSDHERGRLAVRPGLTGWAQVKGRNSISWPDRIELDLWYIANRSLMLDLKILLRTVLRVLRPQGVLGEGGINPDFIGSAAAPPAPHPPEPDVASAAVPRPRNAVTDDVPTPMKPGGSRDVTERLVDSRGGPARQAIPHSRVGSHTAAYLIARGVPGMMAFLAIPVFTNLLEPGAYASYAITVTALGVANSLFFEWIRLAIVRCFPTERKLMSSFTSTIVTLWLSILAIVTLAVVAALAMPLLRSVGGVLILCVVVLATQSLFDLVTEFLRADLKPWHFMVLHLVRAGSFVGLGIIFLRAGAGWTGPLIAVAIGMAVATALAWRGDWRGAGLRLDRGLAGEMFRYGAPISLTVTFAGLIFLSDRALVAVILGSNAAGIYSVAFDFITQTVTLVMIAVSMAVFPIAVRELELHGTDAARRPMMSNAAFLLAVGVPATVGIGVLAPGISGVFFGPEYSTSADIIPLVAVSALLAALKAYHFDAALQLARRTLQQVWIVLGATILGVFLNLILIPVLGLPGAALASVLTFLAAAAFTAWWGRRLFPLPFPVRESLMVLISSAVMGAALFPFRNEVSVLALLTQVTGGALLYFTMLASANFLGMRALARRALRRVFDRRRSGRHPSTLPTETRAAP